ncbi:MAG: HPF/RaiA family ribosome-associated protein [Candidatus Nitrosopumilus sp. bin_68KS]
MVTIPLYVIGLSKDEPANEILSLKFGSALEKVQQVLSNIIEAKIAVEFQNPEGSRTHYDATASVKTSKKTLIYTASGWDILKIADELSRKLEGEYSDRDNKRQRDSIRKKKDF